MFVDDWEKFAQLRDYQERKWANPQKRLTPVESGPRVPPPISGDMQFRAGLTTFGGYPYSSVWQDGSKFETGLSPSGSGNYFDHPVILQNARTAYSESIHARSIVRRYADTVIDTGLKLLPTPKHQILGITPEQAETWADEIAQRFDCWFSSKQCSRDEVDNGYQLQRFVEILTRRDGEYFIRFHYSSRNDLMNPLQLSVVDPTQILGYGITDTYSFNRAYADGIHRDPGGKEIGYKVQVLTQDGYKEVEIPAVGPRSKRRFMLHGYTRDYVDQGRGMSDFAHALQEFSNVTDFSQAQIMKAIAQSQFNFTVVPGKDGPASDAGLTPNAGVFPEEYGGLSTPATLNESGEVAHWIRSTLPEFTARQPGATVITGLQSGEKLDSVQNTAPVEQFGAFVESFMTHIAASVSMPIEVLTMKFGRAYTASMGALILFWRVAERARHEQKWDWLDYVYESWLSEEIAAARVSAPGWSDPLMRSAWLSSRWGGAPMPIIDPSKQSKADKDYVELGSQHLDDVARNFNGSDGRLNRAKLSRQLDELPTVPWSKGGGGGGGNPNPETEEDED
jgi:capsid protein